MLALKWHSSREIDAPTQILMGQVALAPPVPLNEVIPQNPKTYRFALANV